MLIKHNFLNIFQFHVAEQRLAFLKKAPAPEETAEVEMNSGNEIKGGQLTNEQMFSILESKGLNDVEVDNNHDEYPIRPKIKFTYEGVLVGMRIDHLPDGGVGLSVSHPTTTEVIGFWVEGRNFDQAVENMKNGLDSYCQPVTERIMQQEGFRDVKFEGEGNQVDSYSCKMKDGTKVKVNLKFGVWSPLKITLSAEIEGEDELVNVDTLITTREGLSVLHDNIVNRADFKEIE